MNRMNLNISAKLGIPILMFFAIGIPSYVLKDNDWSKFQVEAKTLIIPALYLFVVCLSCFLILGVKGPEITSTKTDKKIDRYRIKASPYINKVLYVVLTSGFVYMAYLMSKLWINA